MYSVVLMVAMTGGADVPAGMFSHGCCGGNSCSGWSCNGGYSCSGWSCNGGSSCHGGHGLFSRGHSCHGGSSCHGGYSCNGCCGGYSYSYSCNGCCGGGWSHGHGCCGGGFFGHRSHGCCGGNSCYGSCSGSYSGCYGSSCYGGSSCIGSPAAPAAAPATMPPPAGEKIESKPVEKKSELDTAAPATLVVSVPADAKLLIDDAATISTSTRRVFVSPTLPAGREFTYSLKAEFTKNGKTVVVNKDVIVKAGAEIAVTMEEGLANVVSR